MFCIQKVLLISPAYLNCHHMLSFSTSVFAWAIPSLSPLPALISSSDGQVTQVMLIVNDCVTTAVISHINYDLDLII